MWTGQTALANLDGAINKLFGEERSLDRAIQSGMAEAERLRQERGQALRELARIKLDEMTSGRLVSNLDAAERRASTLLTARRGRLAEAIAARDAALEQAEAAEREEARAAAAVTAALEAIEQLRAKVAATLVDDPAAKAARAAVAEAEAVATEAERKAEQNAAELAEKKKPYDEDPLFQYLWARGFGTSAYAHGGLTRFLDRMVARFIGYQEVRANYHMLSEIPLRLAEHAQGRRAAIEAPRADLARLEADALARAGGGALDQALAQARAELARADAAHDKARAALAKAEAERDGLIAGDRDPAYQEALATIAAGDAQDDLATLYAEARRTVTKADEAVVRRLEGIDQQIAEADREVAEMRQAARRVAERRTEVERTRDRFRRSGYDHPHATFGNERAIAEALGGILSGALKGAVLWDVLRDGYGHRPPPSPPDFGGRSPFPVPGGWGGGAQGGGWRDPGSSGSWSPAPDSSPWGGGGGGSRGGGGNDDFSTGGRF